MKRLTDIVWPEIRQMAKLEIAKQRRESKSAFIVYEAAVLVEAGWHTDFDTLWTVECPSDVQLQRLMKRNNLTQEEATKRIKSQLTSEARRAVATQVINNSSDLDALLQAIDEAMADFSKH
jgi:dephospho-CoA kinase